MLEMISAPDVLICLDDRGGTLLWISSLEKEDRSTSRMSCLSSNIGPEATVGV